MSPRVRQDPTLLAAQWEAKLQTLVSEGGEERVGNSEEVANTGPINTAGDNCAESETGTPDVRVVNLEQRGNVESWRPSECTSSKNCHLSGTPGIKQSTELNKSDGSRTAQTPQTNQKFISLRGSVRPPKSAAKIAPSSRAVQNANKVVSPMKTSQFVDLADYHKYVPQPPKSRIAGLVGPSRRAVKDDKTEGHIDR